MKLNLQLFLEKAKSLKATDFRKRKIKPIGFDTSLIEIFNKISNSDLPIIPVIDEKKEYIGIVTLRDLLFLFQKRHSSGSEVFQNPVTANFTAEDLINENLPVIYDDDSLETIAGNMSKFESSVLPRAQDRKEQISGLIYLSDVFTEIINIVRKTIVEDEAAEKVAAKVEEPEPEAAPA